MEDLSKICSKCGVSKPLSDFQFIKSRNKHEARCRVCKNLRTEVYRKAYREKNKEKIKLYHQKRYLRKGDEIRKYSRNKYSKNKQYYNEYGKQWYQEHKQQHHTLSKEYYENNKREIFEKIKQRRKLDVNFRLKCNLQRRLHNALHGNTKSARTLDLLGCEIGYLRQHLERQFKEGMSWENYGNKSNNWSLDHIKPMSSFDLKKEEEQRACCHYSNLQPMWHIENIQKGNKMLS